MNFVFRSNLGVLLPTAYFVLSKLFRAVRPKLRSLITFETFSAAPQTVFFLIADMKVIPCHLMDPS